VIEKNWKYGEEKAQTTPESASTIASNVLFLYT
jgi:hypothetical protein